MKSKLLLGFIGLVLLVFGGYYYMSYYYGVKDYSTTPAEYTLTSDALKGEFVSNEMVATQKYQNKAVEVTGVVKSVSSTDVSIEGVSCKLASPDTSVQTGSGVKIKGRVVGYDSLLEEVQIDQCTVVK